jgi:hypothetical protein
MLKRKVISIDGVGEQYSQQLNNAGITNIEHLLDISPIELSEKIRIPPSRLYEFKRKAQIIQEIKIEPRDYEPLLNLECSKILGAKVGELEQTSKISSKKIRILKEQLSNLYVAIDNDTIKDSKLNEVVEYSSRHKKDVSSTTNIHVVIGKNTSAKDEQPFDILIDLNNGILRGIDNIIRLLPQIKTTN